MSDKKIIQNSLLPDVAPRTTTPKTPQPQQQEMFSAAETCAPAKGHIAPNWQGKLVLKSQDARSLGQQEVDRLKAAQAQTSPLPEEAPTTERSCAICGNPATKTFEENPICPDCDYRIFDYTRRVEKRIERLQNRADKTMAQGQADTARASQMAHAIPFGQPILVGHHSERWDRRYRARTENIYRRGVQLMRKAEGLRERAQAAENNHAISADDPAAVIRMREKIAAAQEKQATYKRYNQATRKVRKQHPDDQQAQVQALIAALNIQESTARNLVEPDFAGRYGIPSYVLTNNNANIRRMTQRLQQLEVEAKRRTAAADPVQKADSGVDGLVIVRDLDDNRLRLVFDDKPSAEVRALLKQRGFRWSPGNKAWQRQLNANAEWAAKNVIDIIRKNHS